MTVPVADLYFPLENLSEFDNHGAALTACKVQIYGYIIPDKFNSGLTLTFKD